MVERSLSMREAPGSIPGLSIRSLSVRLGVDVCSILNKILRPIKFKIFLKLIEVAYKFTLNTLYCIERQLLHCNYTVGLVVEYSPATGETRVRFPDGVARFQPFLILVCLRLRPLPETHIFRIF